ncbi:4-(cytidine 5'-diphospho)-2-C-methyl-D-erythritol kinase [Actinomadura craniellae]|uniref:4-(cytidine 5'-diphospho)-2-C-methyl-D-erythritol kinase n=1 Tax=Actinomadura craniellae TaxID=2231787 RepID=UPI0018F25DC3|nr:4-(cytidine 5'-diphospho)-2-C-methyl-D-erythritol kinase [Actinomadura craniellae]
MTVRVPAKVNLQLGVGPLRADGYHDLVTVFHAVSLFDEVTAEPSDRLAVSVRGDSVDVRGVPLDGGNLAARAAVLLAGRLGVEPAVSLHIRKAIPVAGGMAGGSADAAAALVACARLWGADHEDLPKLAAELGSDVPFSLLGGTAIGLGRGEVLTPVPVRGPFHWVFACADGGLSTPAVYAECDRLREVAGRPVGRPEAARELLAALESGDARALGGALDNDLQPAAVELRPALRDTLAAGRAAGALGALVSGSGPTCAFLAESAEHAADLAAAVRAAGVAETVVRAHGPVPGATVI